MNGAPAFPSPRWLLGTALLAGGGLLLEISLTRVLSLLYFNSYAYVVLSVAVLGLGLGAALAAWRKGLRQPGWLGSWAAFAGLAALLLAALTLLLSGGGVRLLGLGFTALPFLFIGLGLSTVFSAQPQASHRLYWADLTGAGLGTFAALPLLNLLGGAGGLLAAGLLLASAALAFSPRETLPWLSVGFAAALLAGHGLTGWLEPDLLALGSPKPVAEQLRGGGRIEASEWDAFARSDLVYRPDQDAYYLYADGAAGSLVPSADASERWRRDIGWFPFAADAPKSAFIVGPGGGLDLALAKAANVQTIVAAELNGSGVQLVRELESHAGDLYGGVTLVIDEGRSALRRSEARFDLIFLSQVLTQTAEVRGYALSEASVYTVQAFEDYLDHLTPEGQLALKLYDELTLTRALLSAVRALEARGLSQAEAATHLMAVLDTRDGAAVPLLLVRNQPIERAEAVRLARTAEALGLALLFVPGLLANPPLDGLLTGSVSVSDLVRAAAPANVQPATDAQPYFFQFERGLPRALRPLVLALALGLVLGGLLLAIQRRRVRAKLPGGPLLFAALGFGFMTLELAVLQRSQLFLGHPSFALSLVLGTLLLGGGLGSALGGGAFRGRSARAILWSSLGVVGLAILWAALWPLISSAFQASPSGVRATVLALSLLPLALCLGLPFPSGLELAGRVGGGEVALAWAINGVLSVVGGAAATALSLLWGFAAVWLAGVLAYAVAAICAFWLLRSAPTASPLAAPRAPAPPRG